MDNPQANQYLSIAIPTYNRAEFLDYSLKVHVPLAQKHHIAIFILDNASTDDTKEVVQKWQREYPFIVYHGSDITLNGGENFERVLKYPDTEYVWLLGDTYHIPPTGIEYILDLVSVKNKKYDVILFNVGDEIKHIPTQDYHDQNLLLHDMFWLSATISTQVYNAEVIKSANFERYRDTDYLQAGIIFEYIAGKKFLIHWNKSLSVRRVFSVNGHQKDTWVRHNPLEIWIERRSNLIFSLPPSYSVKTKLSTVLDSANIGMKDLLAFRASNSLNYKTYKQYSYLFGLNIKYPKFIVLVIALLPRWIPSSLRTIYKKYAVRENDNR